jgi:hypothetical protein
LFDSSIWNQEATFISHRISEEIQKKPDETDGKLRMLQKTVHRFLFWVIAGRAVNGRSFDHFGVSFRRKRNETIRYFSYVSITKRLTQLNSIPFQQRND